MTGLKGRLSEIRKALEAGVLWLSGEERADLLRLLRREEAAPPIYECTGCGHVTRNPEDDLALIRKAGGRSCCPERKMVERDPLTLADALKAEAEKIGFLSVEDIDRVTALKSKGTAE